MSLGEDGSLVRYTARQLASSLMTQIAFSRGLTAEQVEQMRQDIGRIHFHDGSQGEIAWNDVQAIVMYNELTGENLPVPLTATEGYNNHYHSSIYDGGYIPPSRQQFGFSVYHPGTSIPQVPFAY